MGFAFLLCIYRLVLHFFFEGTETARKTVSKQQKRNVSKAAGAMGHLILLERLAVGIRAYGKAVSWRTFWFSLSFFPSFLFILFFYSLPFSFSAHIAWDDVGRNSHANFSFAKCAIGYGCTRQKHAIYSMYRV